MKYRYFTLLGNVQDCCNKLNTSLNTSHFIIIQKDTLNQDHTTKIHED